MRRQLNPFLKSVLPAIWLAGLTSAFYLLPVAADVGGDIQRMRLPAGSYFIGGGGGSVGGGGESSVGGGHGGGSASRGLVVSGSGRGMAGSARFPSSAAPFPPSVPATEFGAPGGGYAAAIPAYCIDQESDAPTFDSRGEMTGWGDGLKVQQLENDVVVAERPLVEALSGQDPWISIGGVGDGYGDPTRLLIHVEKTGYDYLLEAPSGGVFADDQALARNTFQEIQGNQDLFAGIAFLDAIEGDLRKHSNNTDLVAAFQKLKQRFIEWPIFQETKDDVSSIGDITNINKTIDAALFSFLLTVRTRLTDSGIAILDHHVSTFGQSVHSLAFLKEIRSESEFFPTLDKLDLLPASHAFEIAPRVYELMSRGMSISKAVREELLADQPGDLSVVKDPSLMALRFGLGHDTYSNLLEFVGLTPEAEKTVYFETILGKIFVTLLNFEDGESMELFSQMPTSEELEAMGVDFDTTRLLTDESQILSLSKDMPYQVLELNDVYQRARYAGIQETSVADGKKLEGELGTSKASYLNLGATWGDTVIVNASIDGNGGDTIVVDTGNAGDGFIAKLLTELEEGEKRRIRLLITHTDADHIRGAEKILKDSRFNVIEVIIGTDTSKLSQIAERVKALLENDSDYRRGKAHMPTLFHYVRREVPAANEAVALEDSDDSSLNHFSVRSGSSKIDIYQMSNPKTRNSSGLFFQIREAGRTQLLTDDGTATSLKVLLNAEDVDVSAGVLKWPHHIWFPEKKPAELEVLRSMLERTNPHTIILTNRGARQSEENVEKIKAFIMEVLGPHVRVLHTTSDGNITVSKNNTPLPKRERRAIDSKKVAFMREYSFRNLGQSCLLDCKSTWASGQVGNSLRS